MTKFLPGNALVASVLLALTVQNSHAVSASWTGATSGLWSTDSNWSASPAPNGTTDVATFNGESANTSVTVDTVSLSSIVFSGALTPSYTLGAGTITVGNGTFVNVQNTVLNPQTISANIDLGGASSNNPSVTNNSPLGKLTFSGNLTTVGTGTRQLQLNGSNFAVTEFSGNVTASSGPVIVQIANGTGIFSGTNALGGLSVTNANSLIINGATTVSLTNVNNSGLLGGTGSLVGNVNVSPSVSSPRTGPIIAPGDPTVAESAQTGVLDISGNLSFGSSLTLTNSYLNIQLGGATPGDGVGRYDQVNAGGIVTLGINTGISGGMRTNLNLSLVNGYTPAVGNIFYILTGTLVLNQFVGLDEGAVVTALGPEWRITYQATWTGDPATSSITDGSSVAIYAVPEPGAIGLTLCGLAFLLSRSRRRFA